jgi:hypothetical protein
MAYLDSTLPKRSPSYSNLVKFPLFFKRLQMKVSDIVRGLKDQHKRFLNWVDAFWGYDVFIAHRRADASEYARRLYEALTAQRISCFIDRAVYGPGDSLAVATLRHVRKSTVFVLLGSPEILSPRIPKDWVQEEVDQYLASHGADPKIIPVDFGETIANSSPTANSILGRIENFVRIPEALPALVEPPSQGVLEAISGKLDGRRRDRTRVRFFQMAAGVLAILLVGALAAAAIALAQRQTAISNETHALAALSRAAAHEGRALDGVELALAAWPRGVGLGERPMLGDAVRYLSLSFSEHPPVAVLNHNGPARGAIYSPDGKRILSWSSDKTLRLWDAATGAAIGEPLRHEDVVKGAVYSPDGKRILSWSEDKTLRLWDVSWRGDNLFEIACNYAPIMGSDEMGRLSVQTLWRQDRRADLSTRRQDPGSGLGSNGAGSRGIRGRSQQILAENQKQM